MSLSSFDPNAIDRFIYVDYNFDRHSRELQCKYALDEVEFVETVRFVGDDFPVIDAPRSDDAVEAAARIVFLLAGVSYYKAAAPPVVEIGKHGLTPAERDLLEAFYLDGLGEFAFNNSLDLSALRIEAEDREPIEQQSVVRSQSARPLVPFGGGIDSIVTVEGLRSLAEEMALFVVSRENARFEAIEKPMAVTGLPVVRAERILDEKILQSSQLGYRNGHVPVTGVISAIAVMAAVLSGRNAVAMSNEWSASSGNVERGGRMVNHQWSKSIHFEDLFRSALAESLPVEVEYFSWLRPFSELWVAKRFASLVEYHGSFRSCNRAFHIDAASRLDHWCGICDKCAFVDLILAPYMSAHSLADVFDGSEPLANPAMAETFRTLIGVSDDFKPFECVGDVDECRVALRLVAERSDRVDNTMIRSLNDELLGGSQSLPGPAAVADDVATAELVQGQLRRMLNAMGPHRIPEKYAPPDLLD